MKTAAIPDIAARLESLPPSAETLLALADALAQGLRECLPQSQLSEETRLRNLKLAGLAELAAGASHEINTPLAIISGQAQFLLRTEKSPDRAHSLQRIIAQTARIHRLLNNLMFYARPPKLKTRLVGLKQVVRTALSGLADLALERNVTVKNHTGTPRVSVRADGELLELAVSSLVRNAIEAAPAGGWVNIRLDRKQRGMVAVVVEDNGPGLNARQREHLFDPFFSGRSAGRGIGLGLTKAWRVAQLHGGEIHFESEPGQPTRFILSLPAQAKPVRAAPKHGSRSRNGHWNGRQR